MKKAIIFGVQKHSIRMKKAKFTRLHFIAFIGPHVDSAKQRRHTIQGTYLTCTSCTGDSCGVNIGWKGISTNLHLNRLTVPSELSPLTSGSGMWQRRSHCHRAQRKWSRGHCLEKGCSNERNGKANAKNKATIFKDAQLSEPRVGSRPHHAPHDEGEKTHTHQCQAKKLRQARNEAK
jgi:hypothetical protein